MINASMMYCDALFYELYLTGSKEWFVSTIGEEAAT